MLLVIIASNIETNRNKYEECTIITIKKNTETLWVHSSILDNLDTSALEIDSQNYKYNEKLTA